MKALIGRKLGMTQIFAADGSLTPVTLVEAGPCEVLGVRDAEKDGYTAVQLGFETAKRQGKAQAGQFKQAKAKPRYVREIKGAYEAEIGSVIDVGGFEPGDHVEVSATAKGKGFSGTIKRHNFSRGPMTHGSRNQRRPGSIGSAYPQKIFKGKKMAGRKGGQRVTQKRMRVELVNPEDNILAIKGAIPGSRGKLVIIKGVL